MHKRLWWLCFLAFAMLAGCGGSDYGHSRSANYAPTSSYGGSAGAPGYAADKSGGAPESLPSLPPAASVEAQSSGGAHAEAGPVPPPTERPGLGTEWGETRESHVRDVTFFRADPERPFAMATLFYNDRSGVEALAAYHSDHSPFFHEFAARGGAITVSIRDGSGEALDAVRVGDRTYVMGQAGDRYAIVLTNHTRHRFEAVATVDGLDVINGRQGTLSNRGYVLMPYATLQIDGFRQSTDAVAAF